MKISMVVACARNLAIGKGNQLPWSLPDDLKRFRQVTSGHTVVMGRKTFDSIGRPLPNRRNIVITRQSRAPLAGVEWASSLDEALQMAAQSEPAEVFVIGGAEIYREALPRTDRIYLTIVDTELAGDAFFPAWPQDQGFQEVAEEAHPADERHAFSFRFQILERRIGR